MTKLNTPPSSLQASSAWPVSRQNAWKSATAARSVASTRSRSPGAMPRSARLARSTGSGQLIPFTSSSVSLIGPSLSSCCPNRVLEHKVPCIARLV